MNTEVTTERYYIPSEKGQGWAVIFIDSAGVFSTVSDYGNYGYFWSHPGMPFVEFLKGLDEYYVCTKLGGGRREYDGEATHKQVLEMINERVARGDLSEDKADDERSLLEEFNDVHDKGDFTLWTAETALDCFEVCVYRTPIQLQMFYQKVWPRFIKQLEERHPKEIL